jgi:hypothetical protein
MTGGRKIQHLRHMKVTNQSDTWQDLTHVKPHVMSVEASMIGTIHLRDRCRRSRHHRLIGNRDIGDPGHKGFVHFEIAIREIPMSGVQLSAQQ